MKVLFQSTCCSPRSLLVSCSGLISSSSTPPFIELASKNCREKWSISTSKSSCGVLPSCTDDCKDSSLQRGHNKNNLYYLLNNLFGHSEVFQTVNLSRSQENEKPIQWVWGSLGRKSTACWVKHNTFLAPSIWANTGSRHPSLMLRHTLSSPTTWS